MSILSGFLKDVVRVYNKPIKHHYNFDEERVDTQEE